MIIKELVIQFLKSSSTNQGKLLVLLEVLACGGITKKKQITWEYYKLFIAKKENKFGGFSEKQNAHQMN